MKVKCWKCNGRGYLLDKLAVLCTFGLALLDDFDYLSKGEKCPICSGKGYQEDD